MPSPRRRLAAPIALATLAACIGLFAAACGSSGRDMREPVQGAVSPTRSTQTTISIPSPLTNQFTLKSSAFTSGSPIPVGFSCEGPSPALEWSNVPAGSTELALVMVDTTFNDFVHWIVTGIPTSVTAIAEGEVPAGAEVLKNGAGSAAWFGPCPPPGSSHTYNFMLFAYPQPPVVPEGATPKETFEALQTAANGQVAILSGTFQEGATVGTAAPGTGPSGTGPSGTGSSGTGSRGTRAPTAGG